MENNTPEVERPIQKAAEHIIDARFHIDNSTTLSRAEKAEIDGLLAEAGRLVGVKAMRS